MTRAVQLTALVAVAGLFGLLVWKLTHQSHPAKVGGPVPNFSLRRLDGAGTLSLASLRGKPAVINFFASWCAPCKQEATVLEDAWRQYQGRVHFVGVDYHDVTSDGRRFLRAHDVTYPTVADGSGMIGDKYGLTGVPETFVVNAQGRLLTHIAGTLTLKDNKSSFFDGIKAALKP
ncbi:MAG TPA: redoxin domain-containing protein [Gaiellaceae bacterium]|nr:redoxin domain-containing protein [Gaiellaceae bacterium]